MNGCSANHMRRTFPMICSFSAHSQFNTLILSNSWRCSRYTATGRCCCSDLRNNMGGAAPTDTATQVMQHFALQYHVCHFHSMLFPHPSFKSRSDGANAQSVYLFEKDYISLGVVRPLEQNGSLSR
ncbi:hypothetical protein Y032_0052g2211 [Ancylostoma ceylanicum]|uniref:Uncharacterized protein n=1 Tax=Ancylostoma ceylanicum TaxID=53326 RepID=A0A016U861_9BILA|nr:hypothetical protein Y032_0052g2211 [Ancylostoma ceylanicum]